MFMAIRQRGHNPKGELAGNGAPHSGQTDFISVLMPVSYRSVIVCYKARIFYGLSSLSQGGG
jgi:hypothetical protein